MNISANNVPIPVTITPLKAGELSLPSLNLSPPSDITSTTISDINTAPVVSSVNPTYEKPTVAPEAGIPDQTGIKAVDAIEKPVNNEDPDIDDEQDSKSKPSVSTVNGETYSDAEIDLISALKLRDTEVSAHERAHSSVGGQYAGSPNYSYKTGPDGVKYAVSGEVSIDTSRIAGDPQATLQKAQQIKAAALAPVEPSGQDRKVAAKADQMATAARSELLEKSSGRSGGSGQSSARYEASIPEHFTGMQNISLDSNGDSEIQKQMNQRSTHINAFYNHSSLAEPLPSFKTQA